VNEVWKQTTYKHKKPIDNTKQRKKNIELEERDFIWTSQPQINKKLKIMKESQSIEEPMISK
jgi:hypothetical protein